MLTEFRSVRSVHVQGTPTEATQPAAVAPTLPPQPQPVTTHQLPSRPHGFSLNLTGDSPYSSPSPSIYSQEPIGSALSLAELPNDTPFNFDFSNLHPSLGSNMLFQQRDNQGSGHQTPAFSEPTVTPSDLVTGGHDLFFSPPGMGDGGSTMWNQAPIAYRWVYIVAYDSVTLI